MGRGGGVGVSLKITLACVFSTRKLGLPQMTFQLRGLIAQNVEFSVDFHIFSQGGMCVKWINFFLGANKPH